MNKKVVFIVCAVALALIYFISGSSENNADSVVESDLNKEVESKFDANKTDVAESDNTSDELRVVLKRLNDVQENNEVLQKELQRIKNNGLTPDSNLALKELERKFGEKEKTIESLESEIESLKKKKDTPQLKPLNSKTQAKSNKDKAKDDLGLSNARPKGLSDSNVPILGRPKTNTTTTVKADFSGEQEVGAVGGDVIVWHEPDDAIIKKNKQGETEEISYPFTSLDISGFTFNTGLSSNDGATTPANQGTQRSSGTSSKGKEEETLKEIYTIPANSTFWDVTSMSTMIGRVPISGSLSNPFRFKALVSSENLASNGLYIPNLKDMVVSGYLEGDMLLQCLRGTIDSATYTFNDGRVRTIKGGDSTNGLGWISDQWANPCIPGNYVSTIKEYLSLIGTTEGLASIGESLASSDSTTSTSGTTITTAVSGSTWSSALGAGLSGAADSASDFISERIDSAFDAVIVPSGRSLTINIETEMHIDYDTQGRKLVNQKNIEEYLN